MLPRTLPLQSEPERHPQVDPEADAFLNHLRFVSLRCRAKPRASLFETCALLRADRFASLDAHAEALMRSLSEALGKPARLHKPGTAEMTFDEGWLLQLGRACGCGDDASCQFLLSSRIARENRRLIRFLMERITAHHSFNLE